MNTKYLLTLFGAFFIFGGTIGISKVNNFIEGLYVFLIIAIGVLLILIDSELTASHSEKIFVAPHETKGFKEKSE